MDRKNCGNVLLLYWLQGEKEIHLEYITRVVLVEFSRVPYSTYMEITNLMPILDIISLLVLGTGKAYNSRSSFEIGFESISSNYTFLLRTYDNIIISYKDI